MTKKFVCAFLCFFFLYNFLTLFNNNNINIYYCIYFVGLECKVRIQRGVGCVQKSMHSCEKRTDKMHPHPATSLPTTTTQILADSTWVLGFGELSLVRRSERDPPTTLCPAPRAFSQLFQVFYIYTIHQHHLLLIIILM